MRSYLKNVLNGASMKKILEDEKIASENKDKAINDIFDTIYDRVHAAVLETVKYEVEESRDVIFELLNIDDVEDPEFKEVTEILVDRFMNIDSDNIPENEIDPANPDINDNILGESPENKNLIMTTEDKIYKVIEDNFGETFDIDEIIKEIEASNK